MYKILIVDDVPINIKLAAKILEIEGCYEIITALSGQEALQQVIKEQPDLILLDAMMPDMNGIEVAKIIRKKHTNLDLPIIMITAATEQQMKNHALSAEIDEFLSKPIDRVELLTRIRILLKNKELHKELQSRHLEIMRQMDLAKIIQQKLQSTGVRNYNGVRIVSNYFPMYQIGGDIIYIKQLDNNKSIIFMGDASGHGISAALVSTLIKAILEGSPTQLDAGQILTYINNKLSDYFDSNLDDMYVTCVLCIIDHNKGILSLANAGHPLPMYIQKGSTNYQQIQIKSGPPIGIFGGILYDKEEILFEELMEILLYTDGIFPMIGNENISVFEKNFTSELLAEIITRREQTIEEEQEDDFAIVRLFFESGLSID